MKNINQKGFAPILIIVGLLLAILLGVYLVNRQTNYNSRAADETRIEFGGDNFKDGVSTSRLITVTPYYSGKGTPTNFRLSNSLDNNAWVVYEYDANNNKPTMWSLAILTGGNTQGSRKVYVEFLVDGKWTNPTGREVTLTPTQNSYKLGVECDAKSFEDAGPYKVRIIWGESVINESNIDKLLIFYFDQQGNYYQVADSQQATTKSMDATIPSIGDKYSLFAVGYTKQGLTKADINGLSETTFACTNADDSVSIDQPTAVCSTTGCEFKWTTKPASASGKLTELSVMSSYLDTNYTELVNVGTVNPMSFSVKGNEKAGSSYLSRNPHPGWQLRSLKPVTDTYMASLQKDNFIQAKAFSIEDVIRQVPSSAKSSCQVAVTPVAGGAKVDYSGLNGPIRVWLENQDLVSPISSVSVDGADPLRTYVGSLAPYTRVVQYQIASCEADGAGCSGTINQLSVPNGKYSIHCDNYTDTHKCSGYTACTAKGGKLDCVEKLDTTSCGSNDHAEFVVGN